MAAEDPKRVLPMHGPAIVGKEAIQDQLGAAARMLESVVEQVTAELNAGRRQSEVARSIELAKELQGRSDMDQYYNCLEDVGKMIGEAREAGMHLLFYVEPMPSSSRPSSRCRRAGVAERRLPGRKSQKPRRSRRPCPWRRRS